jgi:hypothetical protein
VASRAAALAALESHETSPQTALRALGTLSLGRAEHLAGPHLEALRSNAHSVELSMSLETLALHVDELVTLLEVDPPEDGYADGNWKVLAEQVLDERHGVFLVQRACAVLGLEAPPRAAELDQLARADQDLESQLWRLTALNDHRVQRLESIAPEHRESTWWYSRGAHLPDSAVTHLGSVAALVARFPEAREELDALSTSESVLGALASSPKAAAPPTIEATLLRGVDAEESEAPAPRSTRRTKAWSRAGWLLGAAAVLVTVLTGLSSKRGVERATREKAMLMARAEAERTAAEQNVRRLEEQLKEANLELEEASVRRLEEQLKATVATSEQERPLASLETRAASSRSLKAASGARPAPSAQPASKPAKPRCAPADPMCASF